MSGESGGAIGGGIVILAVAPAVIGVAAAAAVGYGAIKLGVAAGKHGYAAYQKHKDNKQIAIDNCSGDLNNLYAQYNRKVANQAEENMKYFAEIQKIYENAGKELQNVAADDSNYQAWVNKAANLKKDIAEKLVVERQKEFERIAQDVTEFRKNAKKELTNNYNTKKMLIDWSSKKAEDIEKQKEFASQVMQDVRASYEMLTNLKNEYNDSKLTNILTIMKSSIDTVENRFKNGMYEAATADGVEVVYNCAEYAMEYSQRKLQAEGEMASLKALYEGLAAEVDEKRYIDISKSKDRVREMDLDCFCQGRYEELQDKIDDTAEELEKLNLMNDTARIAEIKSNYDKFVKKAEEIYNEAVDNMRMYAEKIEILNKIKDFMAEQNYELNWEEAAGGDLSGEIVVNFIQKSTGNTISFTLDKNSDAENITDIFLDMMFFYSDDKEVTEKEKDDLREALNRYLENESIIDSKQGLKCIGDKGKASHKTEYNNKNEVQKLVNNDNN